MSRFPDDNFGVDISHVDPLERARIALDFEALNAAAPPVKEILFKAQTMGPLAPVRELWQPRPAALAFGFCLLLLLAPWLPQRASLTVMQIGFEQAIPRADADKLAAHLVRQQPANMLLLTEFTPSDPNETSYNIPGHLRVRLTAFNSSEEEIEDEFRARISGYQGRKFDPMFMVDEHVVESSLHSPALLALGLLKPQSRATLSLPDQTQVLAQLARNSEPLLASAVAPKIEQVASGLKLEGLSFGAASTSGKKADFTVPAWPEPVSFSVTGFDALDSDRKGKVMAAAASFIAGANFGAGEPVMQSEMPIEVSVFGLNGALDPLLTGKVQAWVQQPDPDEAPLSAAGEEEVIRKAVAEAFRGRQQSYSATFDRSSGKTRVAIQLEKHRSSIFSQPVEDAAREVDGAGVL